MQIVSFRFLPLIITVSPRKSCNSSILDCDKDTTELSSPTESSTMSRFGFGLSFKIAVERSFSLTKKVLVFNKIYLEVTYVDIVGQGQIKYVFFCVSKGDTSFLTRP